MAVSCFSLLRRRSSALAVARSSTALIVQRVS